MIKVYYVDDFKHIHIFYATSQLQIKFLQDRFGKENVTVYLV